MVRREIIKFELVTEDGRYPCTVPFSVGDLLSSNGSSVERVRGDVRLESEIFAPDASYATKNFYIRLCGVTHPAEVYIGSNKIGECDGSSPVVNLNAAGYIEKGNNTLSIRFRECDYESLAHAGLSMPVQLLRFSGAIIDRVSLTQTHTDGQVNLGIKVDLIGNPSSVRAVATLVSSTGQIYYAGLTAGSGSINVKDPLFWWPLGLGVQNLYRLTVNLYGETDVEDTAEMRIGLRSVAAPISSDGAIMIGDLRVLPMGATYTAEESHDPTFVNNRASAAVTAAAMTGYNCLVIPMDAPRPTDKFYDMCDEYGIMVVEEISDPTEGEISRLRERASHPSFVLVDVIGAEEPEETKAILEKQLPGLIIRTLPVADQYITAPSIPSLRSIRRDIPEGERSLFSHSVEAIAEDGAICDMLLSVAARYPYPKDFASFAYASAMAAAHRVGDVIRDARLADGKAGRAVFSRLCDNKLTISSSAIDHRGRWKPLQYYSHRFFAPARLYATAMGADVRFYAVNHRKTLLSAVLEYRILDAENRSIYDGARQVELSAMTSGSLFGIDFSEYVEGHEREYYLEYKLKEGTTVLSRDVLLFVPEKHFNFKKPTVRTVINGDDKKFSITMAADCFVKDLELDFDGVDVRFSDNYIDLTSDAPIRVEFTVLDSAYNTQNLKDALILRSVADLR